MGLCMGAEDSDFSLRMKIIMIIIFGIGIMGLSTREDNSDFFRIKIFILLHLGDEELCCFGD